MKDQQLTEFEALVMSSRCIEEDARHIVPDHLSRIMEKPFLKISPDLILALAKEREEQAEDAWKYRDLQS